MDRIYQIVCNECGVLELASASVPTECPNNPAHLIGDPVFLREPELPDVVCLPVITHIVEESGAVPVLKCKLAFDFSILRDALKMKILFESKKEGGGSGFFRVWDETNGEELGVMEITSDNPVFNLLELVNPSVPSVTGIELQLYTDGTGTFKVYTATLRVSR